MKIYSKIPLIISMMLGTSIANAIEISPDDRGQLLIAPVYKASEGKSTEIRVVNPSKTHAVKAVVSVRSSANSLEILNFALYLTPTDVWTGELRNTGAGVELYSEDDSILVGFNNGDLSTDSAITSGVFAGPGNGKVFSTFNERDSGQQVELGHFEVLGVYSITGEDIKPGMPKSILFEIDNISYNNNTFRQNGVIKGGLFDGYAPVNTSNDCNGNPVGDLPNHDRGLQTQRIDPITLRVYSYCINTRDDNIALFGEAVLKLSESTGAFRYDLLALRNSSFGDVIANPLFDSVMQQDTPLGVRMGAINASGSATDNIEYINAVFRHDTFEGIYDSLEQKATNAHVNEAGEAESMLVVIFPFKYRHLHSSSPDYTFDPVLRDKGRSTNLIRLDVLNDNSTDRQGTSFDASVDHYDYDYGYSDHAFLALNTFNNNGATLGYPNHGNNNAFIYGKTATNSNGELVLWNNVTVGITSWDTSERFEMVNAESFTTVISGGAGIDTPIDRTVLPYEVNLITDENNQLWYSTKGWYNATFTETNSYPAPTIVMTLTTDILGNSRIDYAVTNGQTVKNNNGNGIQELFNDQ